MKMKKLFGLLLIIFALPAFFTACDNDDEDDQKVLHADAGVDQHNVQLLETVQLDGTNSYSEDGSTFDYHWEFLQKPEGSSVILVNAETGTPSFTPDTQGLYEVQLTITSTEENDSDDVAIYADETLMH